MSSVAAAAADGVVIDAEADELAVAVAVAALFFMEDPSCDLFVRSCDRDSGGPLKEVAGASNVGCNW